ncbi:glycoside hydrolase family 28 protein [Sphingobacterium corticibacterium]|uniref:Glycoside hydrolase family 28 protein n=1 Tax=Sphingobacterium corticibacterium TaxID=2484746 RepID=A0A4Q6XJY2_9SPHI|nr:glycoside hydrolase family 28 protein [Sphingobacterium corticibacterium]RZF60143.1 glycoside hydrolase family 28 protein [Sphingobacterium corticibacterium]
MINLWTKKNIRFAVLCCLLNVGFHMAQALEIPCKDYQRLYKNLPFEMPILERPVFPKTMVNIKDYGGQADGVTLNTEAFEKAIAGLSAQGGGTLMVPSGVWLTGPIVLRSHINLHLEKGAILLFSSDFDLYPLVTAVFEGRESRRCQSPISGKNLENVAITGEGVINGSGEAWRPLKKMKVSEAHWKKVLQSGGVLKDAGLWYPSASALKGDTADRQSFSSEADWLSIKDFLRPVMISLVECRNVLLEGVLFENSPSWNIHPFLCENLIIDNIQVRNPSYAQNGDGLDIESCKNVIVTGSTFDVGDDGICIKSGKDEEGRERGRPTENVIIENCRVFRGHGGFVIGSEMSGGVRNVFVSDCQFLGTNIGLRFKSARGRGGVVENIYIQRVNMFDIVHEPMSFDLYYFTKRTDSIPAVDVSTPIFKDIYISDIVASNVDKAMFFNGLPEMNMSNINVSNTVITARRGAELSDVTQVTFENVAIYPQEGPALLLNNVKEMSVKGFKYPEQMQKPVLIKGAESRNIDLPRGIAN